MSKHRIPITLLIAVFAAVALAPTASARSTHKYHAKVLASTLTSDNGYPGVGGTALLVGSLDSTVGDGAFVDRVIITGHPEPNVFTFIGGEVDYFANGTASNTFAGTTTILANGSQRLAVEGRLNGGTGAYRGARGHYRFVGTAPPGSTLVTGHSSGSITY
jgi:hypothetical protein